MPGPVQLLGPIWDTPLRKAADLRLRSSSSPLQSLGSGGRSFITQSLFHSTTSLGGTPHVAVRAKVYSQHLQYIQSSLKLETSFYSSKVSPGLVFEIVHLSVAQGKHNVTMICTFELLVFFFNKADQVLSNQTDIQLWLCDNCGGLAWLDRVFQRLYWGEKNFIGLGHGGENHMTRHS